MCLTHLRRVSADDATTIGWVNSISAFLHILISAVTQPNRGRENTEEYLLTADGDPSRHPGLATP